MKTVEQRSPVQYSPRRQSMWVLADYGAWKRFVDSVGNKTNIFRPRPRPRPLHPDEY